jgi:asparagine synthase (glutamine-hydrolysing)
MCGIAGAVRLGDETVMEEMANVMAYRGPDDYGSFHDRDVHLVHRRLSILDLSAAGHQPMVSEDGDLVITYNGEIYNFLDLRSELEHSGYRFRSHTDTEIILYAYRRFGLEFLSRLEGMFAFGIWDSRQQHLILARDRLGIKPLF